VSTPSDGRRVPTRTCVACRTARAKRDLIRVVRTPDGRIILDATGRHPGRGAYLCADGACWRLAMTKHALERALQTPLPAELRSVLEAGPTDMTNIQGGVHGQE
jgi:predicted RNA-binding protein YlxR (DUF448 family)